ncbi:hypothetical protein [Aurantiacibacter aquimixticola]|uniref:DUF1579 domain-containing protein n=1 Tax=Aurantiacibacter aquimixticola TaxID=1958945 RepID=A0A419RT51_9SPHN|nr:hypothetical protein [Aurantiacibacter aquimixticola]RJY08958.1 hypothetical protein D6201_05900 [Aurantiacibacter aquimixticola]
MRSTTDLSGEWDGVFTYPGGSGPDTPFLATLRQRGNSITGTIVEPDIYGFGSAEATLVGIVGGSGVDFTKTYRRARMGYENPVDYVGQLQDDGQRVVGMWSLLDWNGSFEMTRRSGTTATETRQAKVEEPA